MATLSHGGDDAALAFVLVLANEGKCAGPLISDQDWLKMYQHSLQERFNIVLFFINM